MHVSDATAKCAVGLISLIHFSISFAEIFLFKRHYPMLTQFNFTPAEAEKAGRIVANAGLYNAFIAAGLLWSLLPPMDSQPVRYFFLTCVAIAGIFGAVTLKTLMTLVLQTIPALIATYLVWIARP